MGHERRLKVAYLGAPSRSLGRTFESRRRDAQEGLTLASGSHPNIPWHEWHSFWK